MNATDSVRRVSVVSTGQVQIRPEAGHVPGVGSRRRLRAATAMVNHLRRRHPDLVILPAHDPGAAARLAQAAATDALMSG
jgi:hypothetical protein